MNRFVERLATRALGLPPTTRPRPRALFEPLRQWGEVGISALQDFDAPAEQNAPPSVDRTDPLPSSGHEVAAARPTSDPGAHISRGEATSAPAASGTVASAVPRTPTPPHDRIAEPLPVAGMRAEPQPPGPATAPPGKIFRDANEPAGSRPPPRPLVPAAAQAPAPESPDPFRAIEPDDRTRARPPRRLIDTGRISASSDTPSAHPIGPPAWADEDQAAPEIKITIGCIDVRVATDAKPKPSGVREGARRRPAFISLESYLERGARGRS